MDRSVPVKLNLRPLGGGNIDLKIEINYKHGITVGDLKKLITSQYPQYHWDEWKIEYKWKTPKDDDTLLSCGIVNCISFYNFIPQDMMESDYIYILPIFVQLNFKVLGKEDNYPITIPNNNKITFYELKKLVASKYPEYSADEMRIFYHGKNPENHEPLFGYGIITKAGYDKSDYFVVQNMIKKKEPVQDPKIKGLIWNDERRETGKLYDDFGGCTTVTNRRIGFRNAIRNAIRYVIQDLYSILKLEESERDEYIKRFAQKYIPFGYLNDISRIRPSIYEYCRTKVRDMMVKYVIDSVLKFVGDESVQSSEVSDSDFLAYLQKNRNYKEECAICLTDKIIGTTCGCGHTEIVVFRPCGHSLCCSPCFYDLCKANGIVLEHDRIYSDHTIRDIYTSCDFKCHMCQQNVERCFRAERIFIGDNWNEEVERLTEMSLNYSYQFC